jgi:hypothetical protein
MKSYPLPPELLLEYYERRRFNATFDRIDLCLKFRSGLNGIGAIAIRWVDGIHNHDAQVKKIEEQMDLVDKARKIYLKENRTFKNWDAAWNSALNTSPEDYAEYLELKTNGETFHERMKEIKDSVARATAEAEYVRYRILNPKCSKIFLAESAWQGAKDTRDEAQRVLVEHERVLSELRQEEKQLAALISDDHVVADSRGEYVSELFPNVHLGHILSTLNGVPVETLPFTEALDLILTSKSPHRAVFRRYDYRSDPMTGQWFSLQQLRDLVCPSLLLSSLLTATLLTESLRRRSSHLCESPLPLPPPALIRSLRGASSCSSPLRGPTSRSRGVSSAVRMPTPPITLVSLLSMPRLSRITSPSWSSSSRTAPMLTPETRMSAPPPLSSL